MRASKVTVTIPEGLLEQIHPEVLRLGMSAYVTEALREQLDAARAEMAEIDAEHVRRRGAADQLTSPLRT